jgi:hypothetical protein
VSREATIDSVFTPWNPPSSQWDTDFTDFTDHRRKKSDPWGSEATIDSVFTPWNPPSSQWDTDFTDFTDQADHRRMESDPLAHAINVSELIHAVEAPSRLKEIIRVHP